MKKDPRNYEVNGKLYAYILDSICSEEVDTESMSDKERVEFALDKFYEEVYKNDRRRMSTLEKLTYWISGLCSTINVAFIDCEIAKIGTEWGYCRTGARTRFFVYTWFERIANGLLRLAKIYRIDMSRF